MSSTQSNMPECSTDCLLQQLKVLRKRTKDEQYLAIPNLSPFLTTNDPLYPESSIYPSAYSIYRDSHVDLWASITIVDNIQAILDSAKETRDEIFAYRRQLRAIFHPMRSLPDDILLLIFEWCTVSHEHTGDNYGSLDNRYPPWQLSHVCHRWRALALVSPNLWSDVYLSFPFYNHIPWEDALASRLDIYLKRSRKALLAVTIDDDGPSPKDRGDIVSRLRVTTDRWRSLRMGAMAVEIGVGGDGGGDDDTPVFVGCSFPNLTRLELDSDTFSEISDDVLTTFRNTPNLVHIQAYSIKLDVDWNNIVSYRTCANDLSHHSLLPSLRELTVDELERDVYEPPDDLPPLSLPTLHTLRLNGDIELLHHLSMPCLETLQLTRLSVTPPDVDYPDLRQWKRLQNLSLHFDTDQPEMEVQPLVSFLAGAPKVVSLQLGDELLLTTTVIRTDGRDDLFPCLESLEVDVSTLGVETLGEVQAIIESRINAPVPKMRELRINLERFVLVSSSEMLAIWETTRERLYSLGVKITSTDHCPSFDI